MMQSAAVLLCLVAGVARGQDPLQFTETTVEAGLLEPLQGMMGHGGAWGDFDNDGRVDLLVGGFCDRPDSEYAPAAGPVPARLLRNVGGKFQLVDQPAVSFHARTSGALFVDLDNDGMLELYVANNARPKSRREQQPQRNAQLRRSMLLRRVDGRWQDITESSGACPEGLLSARNVVPLDSNRDGLLDLLVVEDKFTGRKPPRTVLLENRGGLKFEVANRRVGLPEGLFALGAAAADLNEDGWPDLFLGHSNRLLQSGGDDGMYHEDPALAKLLAWEPLNNEDWPCGAALGDLNNDGRLDLVVSIHHVKARNRVYLNQGVRGGRVMLRDVTEAVGLNQTVPVRCPHVELQDFDNDGRVDIYMSAGWRDGDRLTPLIWRNQGTGQDGLPRFKPPRPIPASADSMAYYPAGPTADYDGDGRLDVLLINWFGGDHTRLLRNTTAGGRWIDVRVRGTRSLNRMGIGAKVQVYRGGQAGQPAALLGTAEVASGYGYASGQPAQCHFGLGDERQVDVVVTLPTMRQVIQRNAASNQVLTIKEPSE